MQLHDQIKTPQGQIPTARARIATDEEDRPAIEFTFKTPEDIAREGRLDARSLGAPPSLEDLSVIAPGNVEDLARRCGPLFGGSARESLLDWQDAAEMARIKYLATLLLSFESEITTVDFVAVLQCFFDEDAIRVMLRNARGDVDLLDLPSIDDGALGHPTGRDALSPSAEQLVATDLGHVQKLIHAIISLHLQGVTLDVFRSAEGDEFLAFDTYLSYLWNSFSRRLGQVKIGLCEVCGKGFSLTGHRGIKRRFCSEECKTKAKNLRRKETTARVREMFAEGASVAQIASAAYPKDTADKAEAKVRSLLEQWVELKHRLADEADAADDVPGAAADEKRPLARRCTEEGVVVRESGKRR